MKMITGCNGFIGSHIASKYEKHIGVEIGNAVHMIDNFPNWEDIDEIIHMGAISSTTETDINKLHFYNVDLTLRLFEQAITHQIPVKYASSASVYGNIPGCKTINPLNHYAMTKAQIDLWVKDNIKRFKHIQGFRIFNCYGQGEDHKGNQASPIHKFTKQAKETGIIKIFKKSETMLRDFVWVGDVVSVITDNSAPSGIYDVGSGLQKSFYDVAHLIAERYNAKIVNIPFPSHLEGKYQYNTIADIAWTDCESFLSINNYLDPAFLVPGENR